MLSRNGCKRSRIFVINAKGAQAPHKGTPLQDCMIVLGFSPSRYLLLSYFLSASNPL